MPSLAITQPYATRPLDLIDATDRSYRQIESAWASALQIQKAVRDLMNIDPKTGVSTAGTYFMPSSISASNRAMYELYINYLNGVSSGDHTGTLDVDKVTFTPTVSPAWPVNGLKDLYYVMSFVASSFDAADSATYLVTPIASNTADAIVSNGEMFALADTVLLVPKNVPVTTILAAIMDLA